jgi:single-strand DNA-binding protein
MNTLTMTGNLTKDPELVERDGRAICKLRLAVDNGRHPTTYIDVSTFDEQAYACAEYLHKGRKVGVSGRLALDEWRTAEDERRCRYSVIGRVEFLDRPRAEGGGGDRQPELEPPNHNGGAGVAEPQLVLAA